MPITYVAMPLNMPALSAQAYCVNIYRYIVDFPDLYKPTMYLLLLYLMMLN